MAPHHSSSRSKGVVVKVPTVRKRHPVCDLTGLLSKMRLVVDERPPLMVSEKTRSVILSDVAERGYHVLTARRTTALIVRRSGRLLDHLTGRPITFRHRDNFRGGGCQSDDEGLFRRRPIAIPTYVDV